MSNAVSSETPGEFDVIESRAGLFVECLGEKVEVRPITVGRLPSFARAVRPMLGSISKSLSESSFNLEMAVNLIDSHGDAIIEAVAAATGRDVGWLGDAQLDEFTELVVAVFSVNLDFFVQRLLPSIEGDVSTLAKKLRLLSGGGRTPSKR